MVTTTRHLFALSSSKEWVLEEYLGDYTTSAMSWDAHFHQAIAGGQTRINIATQTGTGPSWKKILIPVVISTIIIGILGSLMCTKQGGHPESNSRRPCACPASSFFAGVRVHM